MSIRTGIGGVFIVFVNVQSVSFSNLHFLCYTTCRIELKGILEPCLLV